MDKKFLSIHEAAEYIEKSTQTIRRMIKRGDIQAQRVKTPQGFHYVVAAEDLVVFKKKSKKLVKKMLSNSPIQVWDNSPIQNEETPQIEALDAVLINQNKMLINQHSFGVHEEANNQAIDKFEESIPTNQTEEVPVTEPGKPLIDKIELNDGQFWELLKKQHEEKMMMLGILERLQMELDFEKKRPRSFFAHLMDWLS